LNEEVRPGDLPLDVRNATHPPWIGDPIVAGAGGKS
jgi:hypothetical protein